MLRLSLLCSGDSRKLGSLGKVRKYPGDSATIDSSDKRKPSAYRAEDCL